MMTTGSKRKAAKARSSPRFPLVPLDALAQATDPPPYRAGRYAHEHRVSLPVAAREIGVRKQAVHAAWHRLYPRVKPPGRPGRPRSADARTHDVGAGRFRLRASSAELDAYKRAAGDRPLGTWLAEIAGGRRVKTARLRRLALAAAGMSEE